VNRKKDEEMLLKELYYAYDLTENQNRKWLVKISRHWLEKSIDQELNKIVIETLDVVEKYIKGQATDEELEKASSFAVTTAAFATSSATSTAAFTAAYAASSASDTYAASSAADVSTAFWAGAAYKKMLLEIINEMDEFERTIRRKI